MGAVFVLSVTTRLMYFLFGFSLLKKHTASLLGRFGCLNMNIIRKKVSQKLVKCLYYRTAA